MKKLMFPKPHRSVKVEKKKKKETVNSLKKEAWRLFSKWVRSHDAEVDGIQQCITCGVIKHWKQLQAGHFIPGRHSSILFDERGCHPQCYHCNVGLKGNPRAYDAYMRKEYGVKVIKDLERLDRIVKDFKPDELKILIIAFKQRLEFGI